MARTDSDEVIALLTPGKDYDTVSTPSLTPFINAATAMVDRVATCATTRGITLTDAELTIVEAWLAAHLYCMSDQTYASKSTGGASGSFHGQTGMNIDATKYGQTAQDLDHSGCLSMIMKRSRARIKWLGKPQSEKIDYESRD